jgi:hypothetical protein
MTIEQENVIDIIVVNEEEKYISLVISDHLEWDDKNEKLLILQSKINSYLAYIETGQIYEQHPDSRGLDVHIVLTCRHEPSPEGLNFLGLVTPVIEEAGLYFNWSAASESS